MKHDPQMVAILAVILLANRPRREDDNWPVAMLDAPKNIAISEAMDILERAKKKCGET